MVDVLLIDRANGSENVLRNIELARFGQEVYRPRSDIPTLSESVAVPLADCVELVSDQALSLMGLPSS